MVEGLERDPPCRMTSLLLFGLSHIKIFCKDPDCKYIQLAGSAIHT